MGWVGVCCVSLGPAHLLARAGAQRSPGRKAAVHRQQLSGLHFLRLNNLHCCVRTLFIRLPDAGHFGCFPVLV